MTRPQNYDGMTSKDRMQQTTNKNNESICAELVKAAGGSATPKSKKEMIPATERVKEEAKSGEEDEKGVRSAREVISKRDIQLDVSGKVEDQACVICCARKTNAVLMPCCHGGLCYDCAIKISKRKAICHFCRKVS